MDLGSIIKKLRKEKDMKQSELAEKAGISRVAIGNYERNVRIPNAEILLKIANALDVNVSVLLGLSGNIQRYMNISDISENELANKTNLSVDEIKKYIDGTKKPDVHTLKKLASTLNANVLEISGLDEYIDWKSVNKQFYKRFINDISVYKSIEVVKKDFNNFNYEKFKILPNEEKEKVFNDLSTINPLILLKLHYNETLDDSSKYLVDDLFRYITAYYDNLIEYFILYKYKPLLDIIDIKSK